MTRHARRNPRTWLRDQLREHWKSDRVNEPVIDLRTSVENIDVQFDNYVLVYGGGNTHERRGTNHQIPIAS